MKRLEITPEICDLQVRAAGDGSDRYTVRGHASVFDRLSENLGGFRERIARGAFDRVLNETPDVRLLFNHDGLPLARTASQSLELREDPQGLHIWARLDNRRSDAADLRYALEGGEVSQMSFAFRVQPENDVRIGEDDDGVDIYEVREVSDLYDVSLVTYPAYPQTDVSLVRMRMVDDAPVIARDLADRLDRRESDTAAEEPAVEAVPDREQQEALRRLRKRARLLVVRYPLG